MGKGVKIPYHGKANADTVLFPGNAQLVFPGKGHYPLVGKTLKIHQPFTHGDKTVGKHFDFVPGFYPDVRQIVPLFYCLYPADQDFEGCADSPGIKGHSDNCRQKHSGAYQNDSSDPFGNPAQNLPDGNNRHHRCVKAGNPLIRAKELFPVLGGIHGLQVGSASFQGLFSQGGRSDIYPGTDIIRIRMDKHIPLAIDDKTGIQHGLVAGVHHAFFQSGGQKQQRPGPGNRKAVFRRQREKYGNAGKLKKRIAVYQACFTFRRSGQFFLPGIKPFGNMGTGKSGFCGLAGGPAGIKTLIQHNAAGTIPLADKGDAGNIRV